jgi:hypothetical protein
MEEESKFVVMREGVVNFGIFSMLMENAPLVMIERVWPERG